MRYIVTACSLLNNNEPTRQRRNQQFDVIELPTKTQSNKGKFENLKWSYNQEKKILKALYVIYFHLHLFRVASYVLIP